MASEADELRVSIDQQLCTGDGLCVQYAPEVFEFDVDGLAYVKDDAGELQGVPGSRVGVPSHLRLEVIDAARECPGDCIHVVRAQDGQPVAGPDADGGDRSADSARTGGGDAAGNGAGSPPGAAAA